MSRRISVLPFHGRRRLVVVADVAHQLSRQVRDGSEHAASNDVALDYTLRDKGLTKIEISPATLESVRAEVAKTVAQEKGLDIGYPRACYDMTLTDDGYNVKTALVKHLSEAFDERRKASP